MSKRPDWSRPLPRPLVIPTVMSLTTLADVRTLIRHPRMPSREKATWIYVAAQSAEVASSYFGIKTRRRRATAEGAGDGGRPLSTQLKGGSGHAVDALRDGLRSLVRRRSLRWGILMTGLPNHSRLEPSICHLNEDSALAIRPSAFRPAHALVRILSIFLRSRHGAVIGTSRRATGCQKPTQVAWRQDYDLVTWDQAASPLFSAFARQEMSIAPQRLPRWRSMTVHRQRFSVFVLRTSVNSSGTSSLDGTTR